MQPTSARPDWWQDWNGECAAIVGAGPSANAADVDKLKDRIHVIAINESWRLCPWADILYSCDADWWALRAEYVKKFVGIKLALDDPRIAPGINRITIPQAGNIWVNDFLFNKPGTVGSGGNSGFQMINLAAQFGATGIALVGFDMRVTKTQVHWHGLHPTPLRNPDDGRAYEWRKTLDEHAHKLTARGIDVVNCSPVSALTAFPKMTVDEMLQRWGL